MCSHIERGLNLQLLILEAKGPFTELQLVQSDGVAQLRRSTVRFVEDVNCIYGASTHISQHCSKVSHETLCNLRRDEN